MSMIAIERIIANNKVAEESLVSLKREVSFYFPNYFLFSSNVLTFQFSAIKNEKVIAKIDEISK